MKFTHGTRRRAAEYEKDWVQRWKDDQTFQKSVAQRPADNAYVFYDGPPFITGVPHHGTLLSSIVKDAVPRYWTMKGKRVERRWGWDCHGLPAENFVEKQMNIVDRRQIVTSSDQSAPLDKDGQPLPTISLEKYITKARESMVANSETWQGVIDRIGRWVDFTGAYRTMDKDFMESVWWAFKQLYEAGKIYEGEKVLMYDTKFATPVSKAEVTMDNDAYQTVTDPSLYVKFKVVDSTFSRILPHLSFIIDKCPVYLMAWTTTPWTIPANTALAVNPNIAYDFILEKKNNSWSVYIVASKLVRKIFGEIDGESYSNIGSVEGIELLNIEYENYFSNIFGRVYQADFVGDENGTGIVHIAPAYGEDDFNLASKNKNIVIRHVIDDNGFYFSEYEEKLYEIVPWLDKTKHINVWESNKDIAKGLVKTGIAWKIEYIRHE